VKISAPDRGSKAGLWAITSRRQVPATKMTGPKSYHTKKNPNKTFQTKKKR
jgi:hypothetical protein